VTDDDEIRRVLAQIPPLSVQAERLGLARRKWRWPWTRSSAKPAEERAASQATVRPPRR